VRPKSANTISHVEHIVRAYLVPRFGNEIAEDIKRSIFSGGSSRSARRTVCMGDDCEDAGRHEPHLQGRHPARHVQKNPVLHVEMRSKTDYKAASTLRF